MRYHIHSRCYFNLDMAYDDGREGVEVRVEQETRKPLEYDAELRWVDNARGADHEWEPRLGLAEYWMVPV